MASSVTPADEQALDELQQSLLAARPRQLGQGEGDEAFRQHKLLASAIHSATRLHKFKQESETDVWIRYFESYFPRGRNDPQDGRLLFDDWRTSLLKDNTPGPRIPITHGQSHLHWQRDAGGRLCINLEDMWNDSNSPWPASSTSCV